MTSRRDYAPKAWRERPLWAPTVAVALLAAVLIADVLLDVLDVSTRGQAFLDETGHVSTAALVLLLIHDKLPRLAVPAALAASVLIDVDHVPLVLWRSDVLTDGTGRPYSHGLLTVIVLVLLASLTRDRARAAALGLGIGVLTHFLRDVATGPGIPALWPLSDTMVKVPYAAYGGVLGALVLVVAVRAKRRPRARPAAESRL